MSSLIHAVSTELVVGSFALAGFAFLAKVITCTKLWDNSKMDTVFDHVAHAALGFGLLALPVAIFSGLNTAGEASFASSLLINKMLFSFAGIGLAIGVLFSRIKLKEQVWASTSAMAIQAAAGMAASGLILITASAGASFARGESLLSLPYDSVILIPLWLSGILLILGLVKSFMGMKAIKNNA